MPKTIGGAALLVAAILAFAVFRQGGVYALRSWLSKVFLNRPLDPPAQLLRAA